MVRKACTLAPNVLSAQCPTRQALDLIADKWTTLLIYLLSKGKQRYGDLHRQVGGISQKMLTQTLRKLERDGLVTRHVYPEVPPRTEYELTKLGHTLIGPLGALCEWAGMHLAELEQARKRYDHLQKKPPLSA
ncbi:winged helix-turn-helix transcriptional regulator [Geothrix campi]|jgi:DNA-binding HxlR family transcriptional regulator|uniref:winged helix-turn-helix transcriptional regulator n=1 Tax=Geothrix campi TaxID=2966450 RepID=UPI002149899E|nr:helix-turn-helix domain-containing protein [Geothrix sp. SG10]